MTELFPRYPLQAFLSVELREGQLTPEQTILGKLIDAEIIFGRDTASGEEYLVFGREQLQDILTTGMSGPIKGLVIEIDHEKDTDELHQLCALLEGVKGQHDYRDYESFEESDGDELEAEEESLTDED